MGERAGNANRSDRPPLGGREMRLAAVFDHRKVVAHRDPLDGGHVGGLWARKDWTDRNPGAFFGVAEGSHDANSWLGGVQAAR